jgi:hypothetical protein
MFILAAVSLARLPKLHILHNDIYEISWRKQTQKESEEELKAMTVEIFLVTLWQLNFCILVSQVTQPGDTRRHGKNLYSTWDMS